MTFEEYRAAEGVSKSMLDVLATCPLKYHAYYVARTAERKETRALLFGGAYHDALFFPDSFESHHYCRPDGEEGNFTTKAGKAWKAEHSDKPILTREEWAAVIGMRDAAYAHKKARALLTGAVVEHAAFVTDSNGTKRKSRYDIIPAKCPNALADLKTCQCASGDAFNRDSEQYRYYVQGSYYLDNRALEGDKREAFAFICQEKEAPYLTAVHELDPEVIRFGRKEYQANLQTLRNCIESDEWPTYPEVIQGVKDYTFQKLITSAA